MVGEKKVATDPQLEENLMSVLETRTAGDPDAAEVLWTDLSPRQIADAVTDQGTPVSPPVVRDWLKETGLALRDAHAVRVLGLFGARCRVEL